MSYDAAGVYTVPTGTAMTAGLPVYAEDYNAFIADLRTAINMVVNRTVESRMLAALLLGGFKLSNISSAQSQYTPLRYSSVFPSMTGNKVTSDTINTYASAGTVIITGATSPFIQITGTTTINTITAAAADDKGPYYLMVRSVGLQFGVAGNIRMLANGGIAYTTKYADQMFMLIKNNVSGNWNLSLLEHTDTLYWGQTVIVATGTTNFTVPAGVTSLCVVCVSCAGGGVTQVSDATPTVLCRAQNGNRLGDGGGDGGAGGTSGLSGNWISGGGGGAGGYSGNGGNGANYTSGSGGSGTAGSGGGGGGGGGNYDSAGTQPGAGGGGVGLLGVGANGTAGTTGISLGVGGGGGSGGTAGNASSRAGGTYGGGIGWGPGLGGSGIVGGALSYKNNISVTPGQILTVRNDAVSGVYGASSPGAVRFIYGAGRSFPSNAADV